MYLNKIKNGPVGIENNTLGGRFYLKQMSKLGFFNLLGLNIGRLHLGNYTFSLVHLNVFLTRFRWACSTYI